MSCRVERCGLIYRRIRKPFLFGGASKLGARAVEVDDLYRVRIRQLDPVCFDQHCELEQCMTKERFQDAVRAKTILLFPSSFRALLSQVMLANSRAVNLG